MADEKKETDTKSEDKEKSPPEPPPPPAKEIRSRAFNAEKRRKGDEERLD
jgi:hypothetical protein